MLITKDKGFKESLEMFNSFKERFLPEGIDISTKDKAEAIARSCNFLRNNKDDGMIGYKYNGEHVELMLYLKVFEISKFTYKTVSVNRSFFT